MSGMPRPAGDEQALIVVIFRKLTDDTEVDEKRKEYNIVVHVPYHPRAIELQRCQSLRVRAQRPKS